MGEVYRALLISAKWASRENQQEMEDLEAAEATSKKMTGASEIGNIQNWVPVPNGSQDWDLVPNGSQNRDQVPNGSQKWEPQTSTTSSRRFKFDREFVLSLVICFFVMALI